jgi:hypothetical protein
MTGLSVRVKLDAGLWDYKDLDQLTSTEMDRYLENLRNSARSQLELERKLISHLKTLSSWIRDNVIMEPKK